MTYRSNSSKYPTPDQLHKHHGVKFWVYHYHDHNDPDYEYRLLVGTARGMPKYATICNITDDTGLKLLGYGEAICNPKDSPNRSLGHEIAVTRAIKDYMEKWGESHEVNAWTGKSKQGSRDVGN